ncbi:MAG: hypothetical protein GEV08_01420 [Acidimicrobiia bacterium]|nr:hypothetical protein [Acidimicrobiia bacterium]
MGRELLEAVDEAEALEALHALACTDGLPVVVPTPERVERFVAASGLDGDLVLGDMGPGLGAATVDLVAAAAVMAGCLPDHMPVVTAAVQAVCQPEFDLTEMQATTHCTAPLVIVNGPVRQACGFRSGFGALGPGFRANAAVGRALRLAMINIGGGRAGESDMALLGHPGKFSYCLAEDEEASPFTPLHVHRGFAPEESVVTVVGAEAPHSVICITDADDPDSPLRLLRSIAAGIANMGANNAHIGGRGMVTVVVNPDHAAVLERGGYDRAKLAEALCELAVNRRSQLAELSPAIGAAGSPDDLVRSVRHPEDLLVVHAGGGGLYSMVMPSWCAGPHANRAVSQRVDLNPACAIPGLGL